jgi:hypothetical protein
MSRSRPGDPDKPDHLISPRSFHPVEAYSIRRAYQMGLRSGERGARTRQAAEHAWWRRSLSRGSDLQMSSERPDQ